MNKRDTLIAGILSVGLVAFLAPFARLGVDQHHDGIMLKPALDVLSGQVLFRDSFTQYGALSTYLQVVTLWLQPTLAALRFMTLAAYAITLFFLYASWRQILPRSLAALSCGLFILFIPAYEKDWLGHYWLLLPWSSVYALMFQAVGLYALSNVIRDVGAARWGLVLGAACACVFWCRQPVGVIMTGCVAASWLALHFAGWAPASAPKRAILSRMLAGFVLINALLLGSVVLTNAVPEWWYQNFTWPGKWARQMEQQLIITFFLNPRAAAGLLLLLLAAILPGLLACFKIQFGRRGAAAYYASLAGLLLWQHERVLKVVDLRGGGWSALLPVVVAVLAIACLVPVFRKRSAPRTTEYYLVAAFAAVACGSLLQYYPLPDPWHVVWALAPAFGLVVYVFWRGSRWPAPVAVLGLTAALLPAIVMKFRSTQQALAQPWVTLAQPTVLRGMRVLPEFAQRLGRILALLDQVERHRPGIPSALIGNDALFLCFTSNLTNPTPYYVTWIGLAENAENLRRWAYIHATRPVMYLHGARWEAVGEFYRKDHYVPILYFPEDALEVAIPQEVADAIGITLYGARKESGAVTPPR